MLVPFIIGATAVVTAGYNTMAPRSQLYGRTFIGNPARRRQLALTFDDGPNDVHTSALLDVLARHDVHATFFMLGKYVTERPAIAHAVAEAGHAIGNHSFSHPNLIFSSRSQVLAEIAACERALDDAVGLHSRLFRPPHGGRTPGVLRAVRSAGFEPVMWNVSAWDWNTQSADKVLQTIAKQVRGGDVILLHDGGHERMGVNRAHSVRATDLLISRYRDQGYEFVTIPELMQDTSVVPGTIR